ncbi:uncharacterized protein LOC135092319 [Scylla paramamosain]|uniref:uncharacterized protein LOC135092319 n=1 Tax=Scylla paramamosain TaxID=85552 RepID=UPI003082967C
MGGQGWGTLLGEEKKQQSYSETPGGSDAALVRDPKIFAVRISTSVTVLATTTISALSTCLSLNNGAGACTGRKRRNINNPIEDMDELFSSQDMTLSGSLNSDYEEEEEAEEEEEEDEGVIKSKVKEDRNGRKFTIWNSSLTTITVTSTSFFAGTTVTATAFCSAPGLTIGCFGMKIAVVACLLAAGVIAASEGGGEVVNREERASEDRLEQDRRGVRLFALSTTTSIKRLATTTITAINTCLSVIAGTTCTGRRKRALFSDLKALEAVEDHGQALHGTQLEEQEVETQTDEEEAAGGAKSGKVEDLVEEGRLQKREVDARTGRKITIYNSFISTLTLTSTSYLAGTTVTATALCVAPGVTAGCFGK